MLNMLLRTTLLVLAFISMSQVTSCTGPKTRQQTQAGQSVLSTRSPSTVSATTSVLTPVTSQGGQPVKVATTISKPASVSPQADSSMVPLHQTSSSAASAPVSAYPSTHPLTYSATRGTTWEWGLGLNLIIVLGAFTLYHIYRSQLVSKKATSMDIEAAVKAEITKSTDFMARLKSHLPSIAGAELPSWVFSTKALAIFSACVVGLLAIHFNLNVMADWTYKCALTYMIFRAYENTLSTIKEIVLKSGLRGSYERIELAQISKGAATSVPDIATTG